jgi:hypothetical protein
MLKEKHGRQNTSILRAFNAVGPKSTSLSGKLVGSHQEPVSGQACNPFIPHFVLVPPWQNNSRNLVLKWDFFSIGVGSGCSQPV